MLPARLFRPAYAEGLQAPAVTLPVGRYSEPLFIFGTGDSATAIFIGEKHRFETMPAVANKSWDGLAIENVTIEIDIESAFSPNEYTPQLGCLVRTSGKLFVIANGDSGHGFRRATRFLVEEGLPEGPEGLEIAFSRWAITLREGDDIKFERKIVVPHPTNVAEDDD